MLAFYPAPSKNLVPAYELDCPKPSTLEWEMKSKIISAKSETTDTGRVYIINKDFKFPSVNTILKETMRPEKKQALAAWAIKSKKKWLCSQRTCNNCTWFNALGQCTGGQTVRKDPAKVNRCQSFEIKKDLDNYDPRTTALAIGTSTHEWIENYFRSGEFPTPQQNPKIQLIKYLLKILSGDWIAVEEVVASFTHEYAGRLDFFGMHEGQPTVIDWTTSSSNRHDLKIYEDKLIQCAAYAIAVEEMGLGYAPVKKVAVCVMGKHRARLITEDSEPYKAKWLERVSEYYGKHP